MTRTNTGKKILSYKCSKCGFVFIFPDTFGTNNIIKWIKLQIISYKTYGTFYPLPYETYECPGCGYYSKHKRWS